MPRPPLVILPTLLLCACGGGNEDRSIYFDGPPALSPCWQPFKRMTAIEVRVVSTTGLSTVPGFTECTKTDASLNRQGLLSPFVARSYIVKELPAHTTLSLVLIPYLQASCPVLPSPARREFALCVFSSPFRAEDGGRVPLQIQCEADSYCGRIK